jgi:polyferredoxin
MFSEKRQGTRRILLYLSLLLFPLTYYYFSPYLIIEGAARGIIAGSFVVYALMFLGSLFVGRLFCGWLCPAGGLQRLCTNVRENRFKVGKRDWVKFLIWVPWVSLIGLMLFQAGGIQSVDPLYQTYHGISVQDLGSLAFFLLIAGGIAATALLSGKRGFCHYLCWMAPFMILGRRIRNLVRWPSLQLTAEEDKCIDCKTCSRNCPMSLNVHTLVKGGSMEHTECILCGTCIDFCPAGVIHYSTQR